MEYRELGRTGWRISSIGLGTWEIGSGSVGKVTDQEALSVLHRAIDLGVNFIDTADVYGSEYLVGRLLRERRETLYVATKTGRRVDPHVPEGYTRSNLSHFVDDSLKRLGVEVIDLLQLHTPPTPVFYDPEVFSILDDFVKQGKIRYYGVSVEKIEEAFQSLKYPNIQSIQIIFNIFRQRPAEEFFEAAKKQRVGVIARVPLASGLLSGKLKRDTAFGPDDHRTYNRHGEYFDVGETFSGVDYESGLEAVEELRPWVPPNASMAQFALRWILMFDAVTTVIPGSRRVAQVEDNIRAGDLPPLSEATMDAIRDLYDRHIRAQVHQRW